MFFYYLVEKYGSIHCHVYIHGIDFPVSELKRNVDVRRAKLVIFHGYLFNMTPFLRLWAHISGYFPFLLRAN